MRIRAAAAIAGLVFAGCPFPTKNWGRLRTPEMVEQRSGVTADLRAVMAVDEETAWASGTGGTWLRTIDAGRTWSSGPVPGAEQLDFRSLAAFDGRRAIVLSAGSPARMFRTADGGVSWREVYRNDAPGIFFDALRFADESRGYALAVRIGGRFVLPVHVSPESVVSSRTKRPPRGAASAYPRASSAKRSASKKIPGASFRYTSRQLTPPSAVRNIRAGEPALSTIARRPSNAASDRKSSCSAPGTGPELQVRPASMVRSHVPPVPLAHAVSSSTAITARKSAVTPERCSTISGVRSRPQFLVGDGQPANTNPAIAAAARMRMIVAAGRQPCGAGGLRFGTTRPRESRRRTRRSWRFL